MSEATATIVGRGYWHRRAHQTVVLHSHSTFPLFSLLFVANVIVCSIVDWGGVITHFIAYTYTPYMINRATIIVETLSGLASVHW